jgi:hypothetical protein
LSRTAPMDDFRGVNDKLKFVGHSYASGRDRYNSRDAA